MPAKSKDLTPEKGLMSRCRSMPAGEQVVMSVITNVDGGINGIAHPNNKGQTMSANDCRIIDSLNERPVGTLDSTLSKLVGVSTRRINETAKRNYIPESGSRYRYRITTQEYLSHPELREESIGWGGRRKLPYVYTFMSVCYIISRLRLNLSDEMAEKILNVFDEDELLVFDYGYERPEENIDIIISTLFRDVDKIERHYPVHIEGEQFYIDFLFLGHKLAVEVDEYHHNWRKDYDSRRQALIEKVHGFRFIRIRDRDNYLSKMNEIIRIIVQDIGKQKEDVTLR